MNKKLINVVKGDINAALKNGNYNRNTTYQTNIEFNTPTKQILLDGIPYSSPLLTKVTWQELKNKRDASELIPGSLYRITDYQCTTTQENTKSAGHQFDIVLLALSENKLAEEGWAMMHDNIYDVTFLDGVTKKCYWYPFISPDNIPCLQVIDCSTLLALDAPGFNEFIINDEEKTAITEDWDSNSFTEENKTYNYFQNSNLSAWKVWYCLDNDKSRFVWADDSVDEVSIKASINNGYYRDKEQDIGVSGHYYYAWFKKFDDDNQQTIYTLNRTPQLGDITYVQRFNPRFTRFDMVEDSTVAEYVSENKDRYVEETIEVRLDKSSILPNVPDIMSLYFDVTVDVDNVEYKKFIAPVEADPIEIYVMPNIEVGNVVYMSNGDSLVEAGVITDYTPGKLIGIETGRGIIYRMIDEWNNDCPYDFKNIKFNIPLTAENKYDVEGTPTWVYTFDALDGNGDRTDATLIDRTILIDDGYCKVSDNYISLNDNFSPSQFWLPRISFLVEWDTSNGIYFDVIGNIIKQSNFATFKEIESIILIGYNPEKTIESTEGFSMYLGNKKVLTEK